MNNNIIMKSIFITFFVYKLFQGMNSQSTLYIVESNNTMTTDSLNYDKHLTDEISHNCSEAFEVFTEKVTNLTRCTLQNARPVRICMYCEEGMYATNETYSKLLKVNITL